LLHVQSKVKKCHWIAFKSFKNEVVDAHNLKYKWLKILIFLVLIPCLIIMSFTFLDIHVPFLAFNTFSTQWQFDNEANCFIYIPTAVVLVTF